METHVDRAWSAGPRTLLSKHGCSVSCAPGLGRKSEASNSESGVGEITELVLQVANPEPRDDVWFPKSARSEP